MHFKVTIEKLSVAYDNTAEDFFNIYKLESRLIYVVNERLRSKVLWPKVSDSEWIYFGAAGETDHSIVHKNIMHHIPSFDLYVSLKRLNSFQTNKDQVLDAISHLAGYEDFALWGTSFLHCIEFNKIGVLRCGRIIV